MKGFEFHVPTEIVFGKGAQDRAGALAKKHGATRALIVYGGGSAVRSGLVDAVTAQLEANGVTAKGFGGATANPRLSHVRKGIAEAIAFGADFILAVGGGSPIDAAKYIAHGVASPDTDIRQIWKKEVPVTRSIPIGVVLTIPAAGSETSASAVMTDSDTSEKRGINTEFNRPRFALMNPELAATLPAFQVGCGVVDILMHTLDRFFSPEDGNETTDELAASIMRVVVRNGRAVVKDPSDYGAMSEVMWCGSLSHNGITGLGRTLDFSVHQLGHELGGMFDVAHGASLSAVWGSWAEYCMSCDMPRFARYARMVWGTGCRDEASAAREGIDATVAFFKEIGMPTCFSELGIGVQSAETVLELSDRCVFRGKRKVGSFRPIEKADAVAIYGAANR